LILDPQILDVGDDAAAGGRDEWCFAALAKSAPLCEVKVRKWQEIKKLSTLESSGVYKNKRPKDMWRREAFSL